jgi:pyruvate carboxylase
LPIPRTVAHRRADAGLDRDRGGAARAARAGTTLLALEAMKMETHIAADRDGEIAAVHVKPGDRVAAKDLLIELKG